MSIARVAVWAALVLGCVPLAHAQEKLTLATANASVSFMLSRAAVDKGFFKAEGLEVDIRLVPGGNDAIQALVGGSVDFGESSHAQFIAATARKLPIVAIGLHSHGFLGKLVAAPKNASLTNLADWRGKRLGIQVGTGVHTVFLMALEKQGLKEADFTISNVRVNDMPAAMQANTFDAVLAWEPQASRIAIGGFGKEVISSKRFEELADITYPFLVLTTEKTLKERPQTVQKYLNAFARGQRFVQTERTEAIQILRKALPPQVVANMKDEELHEQLYGSSLFERIVPSERDMADLERTADFLARQKSVPVKPEIAKVTNFTFARAVK